MWRAHFRRARSKPRGRPRIPADLQRLIADIAAANHTSGEERIAAELRLKLGLTLSRRTVRRCMPRNHRHPATTRSGQCRSVAAYTATGAAGERVMRVVDSIGLNQRGGA